MGRGLSTFPPTPALRPATPCFGGGTFPQPSAGGLIRCATPLPLGLTAFARRYLPPAFGWGTDPESPGGTFPQPSAGGLILESVVDSRQIRTAVADHTEDRP